MTVDADRMECTDLRLRQLGRLVTRHYDELLKEVGLKNSQYALLSYLEAIGPMQLRTLAARMRLDASTLTRNLQFPVSAGWIVVTQGDNGRSRVATLTPSGHKKVRSARPVWAKAQKTFTSSVGPTLAATLQHALEDSLKALEGAGDSKLV